MCHLEVRTTAGQIVSPFVMSERKAAKTFFDKPKRFPCNLLSVLLDLMGVIRNAAVGRESLLWERERWKKPKKKEQEYGYGFHSWLCGSRVEVLIKGAWQRAERNARVNLTVLLPAHIFPLQGQPTCRLVAVRSVASRGHTRQKYEHSLWNSSQTWAKICIHIRRRLPAVRV